MKKCHVLFIAILVLFINDRLSAQAPAWDWAHVWGGDSYVVGNCITTDASGNVYAGGEFFSSRVTKIGSDDTVSNSGTRYDFFIVKYTVSGSVAWLRSFGSPAGDEKIKGIATDAAGNVYITGNSTGSTLTMGSFTLSSPGAFIGAFVAKLDPSGNVLWARQSVITSSTGAVTATSIAVDDNNNVVACGTFTCPDISFDTASFSCVVPMYSDMYLVKYDESGNFVWARSYGDINSDLVFDIATDNTGNICFTGYFNSTSIDFGSFTLTNSIPNPNPIFIAKMDPDGNILWASSGDGNAVGYGIATDPSGNVIITGSFTSTFILGGTTLVSSGGHDLFLAKYDANGTLIWAKRNGGAGVDRAVRVAADNSGSLYVTGDYGGSVIVFGDSTLINPDAASDLYIAKYDPSGTAIWGMTAKGGSLNDYIKDIATDKTGNSIYITGYSLNDTMKFGDADMIAPPGNIYEDALIAKVTIPVTAVPVSGKTAADVKMYPNPAMNLLTVYGSNINGITISDVNGKVILLKNNIHPLSDRALVDISVLVPGVYSVKVMTRDAQKVEKLIKQ